MKAEVAWPMIRLVAARMGAELLRLGIDPDGTQEFEGHPETVEAIRFLSWLIRYCRAEKMPDQGPYAHEEMVARLRRACEALRRHQERLHGGKQ